MSSVIGGHLVGETWSEARMLKLETQDFSPNYGHYN